MSTILKKTFWSLNFSIIFLLGSSASLYAMDNPKEIINTMADKMAKKAAEARLQAQRLHTQQQQEKLRQIKALEHRLTSNNCGNEEKDLIRQQLAAHQREIEAANDALRRSNERWDILQTKFTEFGDEIYDKVSEQLLKITMLKAIREQIKDLMQPGMAAGFILMLKNPNASKALANFLCINVSDAVNIIKLIEIKINSLPQSEQTIENYLFVALGYMPGKEARELVEYVQLIQRIEKVS